MNYAIASKGDFMGNIFLFSLIIGLASALVLIPFSKTKNQVEKGDKQPKIGILITAIILLIVIVFAFYYFSNLDRNLTSLWIFAIIITATRCCPIIWQRKNHQIISMHRQSYRRYLFSNSISF